jgi:hypothetical protein
MSPTSFTLFPLLPTELRLKIWITFLSSLPAQQISFTQHNSDLDYLRLNRKACHDYYHICALKSPIPSLLHVNSEARGVALGKYQLAIFDNQRVLAMGRGDTDAETFTTCTHEAVMNEGVGVNRGMYWDPEKDVVVLKPGDDISLIEEGQAAYIWGGNTGARLGKVKKLAMHMLTLTTGGLGNPIAWESVDFLLLWYDGFLERFDDEVPNWPSSPSGDRTFGVKEEYL